MDDLRDDPEFREWEKRVRDELVPKLDGSALTVSLVPEGKTDVKFAVELGLSIMLDKPIVAVVKPGVKVPERLARVVDRWVEGDVTTEEGREKMAAAIRQVLEELG